MNESSQICRNNLPLINISAIAFLAIATYALGAIRERSVSGIPDRNDAYNYYTSSPEYRQLMIEGVVLVLLTMFITVFGFPLLKNLGGAGSPNTFAVFALVYNIAGFGFYFRRTHLINLKKCEILFFIYSTILSVSAISCPVGMMVHLEYMPVFIVVFYFICFQTQTYSLKMNEFVPPPDVVMPEFSAKENKSGAAPAPAQEKK